ncbi:MAG: SDR family oxidoreductase, partial [Acidobacteria bacterium]|nr:SDR family oxidoreductase [Acidobacteriota bacterium]
MRILVFGAGGMLGHKLIQILSNGSEVWGTVRGDYDQIERFGFLDASRCLTKVDVFDESSIRESISASRPDVVINAVGVVKQLETSKDVIKTLTVNSIFPHRLAALSDEFGFRLICISTDCVFDGVKGSYTEDDIPNATDLYGKSKNLGEVTTGNSLTLRTSIIGRELGTGHSLIEWFLSNEGAS